MRKRVQFCPRCGSRNIEEAHLVPLGDPLKAQGLFGWKCLECGYIGKDFFTIDEEEYKVMLKKFKRKS